MSLTDTDMAAFLADRTKRIDGNIVWNDDEDHSPAVEFRVSLAYNGRPGLEVRGCYNRETGTLSYLVICPEAGRIYALDMGVDHRNPDGVLVGEIHKHRWCEQYKIRQAYVPPDVTASANDPVAVWQQFCTEARITHTGALQPPPPQQLELFT